MCNLKNTIDIVLEKLLKNNDINIKDLIKGFLEEENYCPDCEEISLICECCEEIKCGCGYCECYLCEECDKETDSDNVFQCSCCEGIFCDCRTIESDCYIEITEEGEEEETKKYCNECFGKYDKNIHEDEYTEMTVNWIHLNSGYHWITKIEHEEFINM